MGGFSFAELAKTSGEFAFGRKGESVYLFTCVSRFTSDSLDRSRRAFI